MAHLPGAILEADSPEGDRVAGIRCEFRPTLIEARTGFANLPPHWIVSSGMEERLWSPQVQVRKGGVGIPGAMQWCRPLPAMGISLHEEHSVA